MEFEQKGTTERGNRTIELCVRGAQQCVNQITARQNLLSTRSAPRHTPLC